jgi:hypothetical protein
VNSWRRWGLAYKVSGKGSEAGAWAGRCKGRMVNLGASMFLGRVVLGEVFGSGMVVAEKGS